MKIQDIKVKDANQIYDFLIAAEDKSTRLSTKPLNSAWQSLADLGVFKDEEVVDRLIQKICEEGKGYMLDILVMRLENAPTISSNALKAAIENNSYSLLKGVLFSTLGGFQVAQPSQDMKIIHKNETYALFLLYQADLPGIDKKELLGLKVGRDIEGSGLLYKTLHQLSISKNDNDKKVLEGFAKNLASEGYKLSRADVEVLYRDASGPAALRVIAEIGEVQQGFQAVQAQYLEGCKSLYGEFKQQYEGFKHTKDHDTRNEEVKTWLANKVEWLALEASGNETLRNNMDKSFKSEGFKDALKSSFKDEEIDKLMAAQRGPSGLAMGFLVFLSLITFGVVWALHKQDKGQEVESKLLRLANAFEATLQSEYVKAERPTWVNRVAETPGQPGNTLQV